MRPQSSNSFHGQDAHFANQLALEAGAPDAAIASLAVKVSHNAGLAHSILRRKPKMGRCAEVVRRTRGIAAAGSFLSGKAALRQRKSWWYQATGW